MPGQADMLIVRLFEEIKGSNWWSLTQNSKFATNLLKHPGAKIGIAEGDSWFDYRFTSKFIHQTGEDLIGHLCDDGDSNVFRLSFAGDTLERMASEPQMGNFRKTYEIMKNSKFAKPDFVMFSGGGNDMAGQGGEHLKTVLTSTGLNVDSAVEKIAGLMKRYRTMIMNVRAVDPDVPVFLHGYAYPIPDGSKVFIPLSLLDYDVYLKLAGAWLQPAFEGTEISVADRQFVINDLIDLFNEALASLAKEFGNVAYVDLRDCLPKPPYADYRADWANEMHPTSEGFRKIAMRMKGKIFDALK